MKRLNMNASIESFLVMILMIIFVLSIMFIIIEGKEAFERVTENKEQDEHARIALSYVNKRIKQDDRIDGVDVLEEGVEGLPALQINHKGGFSTYVFYYEGMMYECYTDEKPTLELSMAIVPVKDLTFEYHNHQIITSLVYEYQGKDISVEQVTTLRGGRSE